MRRILWFSLLLAGMIGSSLAQVDVTKLITGNQASPEAIASIRLVQTPQ